MSKKCTTNPKAPLPPCPEGYEEYKNKHKEQCCRKLSGKKSSSKKFPILNS